MKIKLLIVFLALAPVVLSAQACIFPPPYNFTSADILNDPSSGDIDIVHAGHGRWYLQHIPSAGLSAGFCPIVEYMPIRAIADLTPYAIPLAMPPRPLDNHANNMDNIRFASYCFNVMF